MHKDDQMTPKERAQALSKGEQIDRMPIAMFYFSPGHRLLGLTADSLYSNARTYADIQKKAYEVFGQDGVTAKYGLHSMGIAFGATVLNPPDNNRAIINHPIKDICDLSILDMDVLTVKNDDNVRRAYESAQMLIEELGDEVGCSFGATGPFTCANALLGVENLMGAIIEHPEELHRLLDFTTNAMIQITKPFLEMGCGMSISEPMASGVMLSEKHFRTFVLPYEQRYVAACKAIRPVKITLHICGDSTNLLESMADCNIDTISLDNKVDIAVAKERIGHRVHLMGNVDPVEIIYSGTPDMVERGVEDCFRKGWDNPKGYTICTGCDTAMETPLENSLAYMRAARRCAKYPLNPENFC